MPEAAFDTDILTKCSIYEILDKAVVTFTAGTTAFVLGSARYTVPAQLRRLTPQSSGSKVEHFNKCIDLVTILEPTKEEGELAARLELTAQAVSASLDAGESQLVAIVVKRAITLLITGDKRAIKALHLLQKIDTDAQDINGKVVCLEQVLQALLECGNEMNIRNAVCSNPQVDKAASICFACHATDTSLKDWKLGLSSYIGALNAEAPGILSMVDS